jgi:serine/threonine-protein kinase
MGAGFLQHFAKDILAHMRFVDPTDLMERATRSTREPGCIEITTNNIATIIRPSRLLFEAFGYDPEWNYFRLEAADLEPSGVYQLEADTLYEELTDLGGESYVDRSYWDQNEYDEHPLPEESRVVMRFFRGAFVIFQKTSLYNQLSETYDARHNKMSADEFREYIRKGAEYARSKSLPRRRLK